VAARDEILELKQALANFEKALLSNRYQLVATAKDCRKAKAKVEGLQVRLRLHTGNRAHMKRKADLVVMEEYSRTVRQIVEVERELATARYELAVFDRARAALQREIVINEKAIKQAKDLLGQYGQVEAFPLSRVVAAS
jgi:hypothetical protein